MKPIHRLLFLIPLVGAPGFMFDPSPARAADPAPVKAASVKASSEHPKYPGDEEKEILAGQARIPAIYLNQSGFNLGKPKRFTAPTLADGTKFSVRPAGGAHLFSRGRSAATPATSRRSTRQATNRNLSWKPEASPRFRSGSATGGSSASATRT